MLKVSNIIKLYGKQKVLNNINFEISKGEIVGFIGPNGAGKSTTMKIITGYIAQNSGKVFVNNIDTQKNIIEIRKQIGYLPEHNPLYLDMYVKEYLNFTAKTYKIKENIKNRVNEIIELTGLTQEYKKKISALSKGYRQRLGLAAALIHDPEVLILDEPTTGLDPNQIIEIRNLISEVGKNKIVMLSTHIMQEVEAICSRAIIIDKGNIVADNNIDEISIPEKDAKQVIIVEFDNKIEKEKIIEIELIEDAVNISGNNWAVMSHSEIDIRKLIFSFAVENSLSVLSMKREEKSVEDIFRELTTK